VIDQVVPGDGPVTIPRQVYEDLMRLAIIVIHEAGGERRVTRQQYAAALAAQGGRPLAPALFLARMDGDDLLFTITPDAVGPSS
jgi:dienelactone hydrolase